LKTTVLAECEVPGASIAQVALTHELNANLIHKWRRQTGKRVIAGEAASFIPVTMTPCASAVAADIRIELRRGALAVNVTWPLVEAASCAAWMRELLR
jgi:transposase